MSIQLCVRNNYTDASTDTLEELDKLRQLCTLTTQKYFRYRYKVSKEGREGEYKDVSFCYLHNHKFPSGWTIGIVKHLRSSGYDVSLEDFRTNPKKLKDKHKFICSDTLRPYQEEASIIGVKCQRGIFKHATRSGKTYLAADLFCRLNVKTLYIVPDKTLLDQTVRKLRELLGDKVVGIIGDGKKELKDLTVTTIQSMWRIVESDEVTMRFFKDLGALFIDECHHVSITKLEDPGAPNTWYSVAMHFDCRYRFGFTATPGDKDSVERRVLQGATGSILHIKTPSELIKEGYLCAPKVKVYEFLNPTESKKWKYVHDNCILKNEKRNELIKKITEEYVSIKENVVIIVDRKDTHGKVLHEMIPGSTYLHGGCKTSERKKAFEDFESGKVKILIGTILSEGVNLPSMNVVILAGGGKSDKMTVQRLGRVLTKPDGKEKQATIIDIYDYTLRQNGSRGNRMLDKHSKARMAKYLEEKLFEVEIIKDKN